MKRLFQVFLIWVTLPVFGFSSDYIVVIKIRQVKIPCKVINLSNDAVRYIDNQGQSVQIDVKENFVQKIKFNGLSDTIFCDYPDLIGIEVQINRVKNDEIQYLDILTGKDKAVSTNKIAYIDYFTLDSIKLSEYQQVLNKYVRQQYDKEFIILVTPSSEKSIKLTRFNSEQLVFSYKSRSMDKTNSFLPRNKLIEIIFNDKPDYNLFKYLGAINAYNFFNGIDLNGQTLELNSKILQVWNNNSSQKNKKIKSFEVNNIESIENKNLSKVVKKENQPYLSRFSIGFGVANNRYKLPEGDELWKLTKLEKHENKLKRGVSFDLSYSLYDKSGHGAAISYKPYLSMAKTTDIQLITDTANTSVEINEKNFRHYFGISYSYITSTSLIENRNMFRFSLGPGLMLNYFPAKITTVSGTDDYKIKNTSVGINASIGYDIILNSYFGLGFDLSYIYNHVDNIRFEGIPMTLTDDLSQINHQIAFTFGLRIF